MLPVGAAYVIHRIYGAPHTRGTLCAAYMIVAYVSDAPHTRRLHGLGPWRRAGHCLAASGDVAPPPWPLPVTPYIGVTYIRPISASPIEPICVTYRAHRRRAGKRRSCVRHNSASPSAGKRRRAGVRPGIDFARYAARFRPVRGALSPGARRALARYAARFRPVRGALLPGTRRAFARYAARFRPVRGAVCAPCAGGISLLRGWRVCALCRGPRDAAAQALNACLMRSLPHRHKALCLLHNLPPGRCSPPPREAIKETFLSFAVKERLYVACRPPRASSIAAASSSHSDTSSDTRYPGQGIQYRRGIFFS